METNEKLAGLWQCEQEILDVIHKVCIENGLRYSLAYGTLLGAVRHGGFIPWDDDIDIIMPREDYEQLIAIWESVAPSGYILQNKRTNPDYSQNFTKIRKDHTAFIQGELDRKGSYHKGIFVDIFPGDRVAPAGIKRKFQYIACAMNLLYSRGFTSGSGGIIGIIEKVLIKVPAKLRLRLYYCTEKYITKNNGNMSLPYFFPNVMANLKTFFEPDIFVDMKPIAFNGREYCAVRDPHTMLTTEFGDYMQFPPEKERVWKHHPEMIDFEHNYEELPNTIRG